MGKTCNSLIGRPAVAEDHRDVRIRDVDHVLIILIVQPILMQSIGLVRQILPERSSGRAILQDHQSLSCPHLTLSFDLLLPHPLLLPLPPLLRLCCPSLSSLTLFRFLFLLFHLLDLLDLDPGRGAPRNQFQDFGFLLLLLLFSSPSLPPRGSGAGSSCSGFCTSPLRMLLWTLRMMPLMTPTLIRDHRHSPMRTSGQPVGFHTKYSDQAGFPSSCCCDFWNADEDSMNYYYCYFSLYHCLPCDWQRMLFPSEYFHSVDRLALKFGTKSAPRESAHVWPSFLTAGCCPGSGVARSLLFSSSSCAFCARSSASFAR